MGRGVVDDVARWKRCRRWGENEGVCELPEKPRGPTGRPRDPEHGWIVQSVVVRNLNQPYAQLLVELAIFRRVRDALSRSLSLVMSNWGRRSRVSIALVA